MKIDVAISAAQVHPTQIQGKLVVVIDVLRATSVICTGLYHGAKAFIPVETVDEALQLQIDNTLLAGERNGFKIDNFNLGNSPLEYTPETVKDKTIILTTTNGTRAIKNSTAAHQIIIGSFLNIDAVCEYILKTNKDLCIVCAGTLDQFSLDDALCAGNMISLLTAKDKKNHLTDAAFAHLTIYNTLNTKGLHTALKEGCHHYSYLQNNGFTADLDYCLRTNTCPIVPILVGETISI